MTKIPVSQFSRTIRSIGNRKILLVILLLAFLPGTALSQSSSLTEGLQPIFVEGVEALKKGDLDTAERDFIKVLEQGGKVAFVYNNLGAVYQQRRQYEKALSQLREAIRLDPGYAAPHVLAGASLMALGKIPEAIEELKQAVKLEPNAPLARLKLAQAYDQTDNLFGLVEQYQKLRDGSPRDPEYTYQLGKAYMRMAAWCSEQIEKLNPNSARLHQSIANNYVYQGNTEKAIEYLNRAIQADPKLPDIHLALAQLYQQKGLVSEALQEIELELAIIPNNLAALTLKGQLASRK
jgi:superkiller protein 3